MDYKHLVRHIVLFHNLIKSTLLIIWKFIITSYFHVRWWSHWPDSNWRGSLQNVRVYAKGFCFTIGHWLLRSHVRAHEPRESQLCTWLLRSQPMTDRIPIKPHLTGKPRLIWVFSWITTGIRCLRHCYRSKLTPGILTFVARSAG